MAKHKKARKFYTTSRGKAVAMAATVCLGGVTTHTMMTLWSYGVIR